MKPAYIISAYKRPDLLFRLVEALGDVPIAVHVDLKSDIFPKVQSRFHAAPNVTLLHRHLCHWGLFGHVKASLEGTAWFLETEADYAILLTGQCYPIKTQQEIVADLRDLEGRSILENTAFPKPEWSGEQRGGFRRLDRYYFNFGADPMPRSIKPWPRRVPAGLHPYGGSGYWCLSRACIEYVMAYVRSHDEILRFFSTTLIPDETFFQTILANSPLRVRLVSALIHFTDWSAGAANPAVLGEEMLPKAMASGAWFARKFEDPTVLDRVDALRERRVGTVPRSPWRDVVSNCTP